MSEKLKKTDKPMQVEIKIGKDRLNIWMGSQRHKLGHGHLHSEAHTDPDIVIATQIVLHGLGLVVTIERSKSTDDFNQAVFDVDKKTLRGNNNQQPRRLIEGIFGAGVLEVVSRNLNPVDGIKATSIKFEAKNPEGLAGPIDEMLNKLGLVAHESDGSTTGDEVYGLPTAPYDI